MKSIQNEKNEPESGPQSFWEFLDKWLHKLAHGSERPASVVKFVLIGGAGIYIALVMWRIWLISQALTMFGVDITSVLPVDSNTAALIHKGLNVLMWFAPDAIFAYILLNRHVEYWRTLTAVALICAVGTSWWATHEPGLGTHCYVITPNRGLIETYVDKNGRCGVDRPSGLQMSPVTQDILMCIRALKHGAKPRRLALSAINAAEMFDSGDGHSLYWFHQDSTTGLDFYDGPGFDQAESTPLKPVTHQNAEKIRQYIKKRQETERAAAEKVVAKERAAAERKQAQAAREIQKQMKSAEENSRREAEMEAEDQRTAKITTVELPLQESGREVTLYPTETEATSPAPALNPASVELSFWDSIKNSNNHEDFRAYLSKYPNGQFAALARNRLKPPAPQAPSSNSDDVMVRLRNSWLNE